MTTDEKEYTIEADTLLDAKELLNEKYGKGGWEIRNRRSKTKPYGFLHLRTKDVQVITYVLTRKNTFEQDDSRKIEEQRLESNKNAVLMTSQYQTMVKKIDELNKQISSINNNINIANNEKHESVLKIIEILESNEFTASYINMIEDKIRSQFSLEELDDFKLVQRYVVDWIGETIQIAEERAFRPPHVIIIVGPTGVGKTTTIAKLASNTILNAKKNGLRRPEMCIVTIDTMRVGAEEQLAKFGDILGKDVLKAEKMEQVKEIYEEYKEHVDYIFIDTSGYSPNDMSHISEMRTRLDVKMNSDVYLSVSATTKASDLQKIFRNYEPFAYESVIVTKCDETEQIGNVLSVLYDRHKAIAYITDGQGVPKNIKRPSKVELLMSLNGFDIDRIHIEDKFGE